MGNSYGSLSPEYWTKDEDHLTVKDAIKLRGDKKWFGKPTKNELGGVPVSIELSDLIYKGEPIIVAQSVLIWFVLGEKDGKWKTRYESQIKNYLRGPLEEALKCEPRTTREGAIYKSNDLEFTIAINLLHKVNKVKHKPL